VVRLVEHRDKSPVGEIRTEDVKGGPGLMSASGLKGVAPKHVTLNQIFAGMMPYMLIVIVCMVIMYLWPGMTLWLPA
jgi:TRAP-type mannitol/chloroaromatic compound transport system permease large subunit